MDNFVCFSGYRPNKFNFTAENKKAICQKLICEITTCTRYGFDSYYSGAAPGFDLLAAHAIIYLKRVFDIRLVCALPYKNFHLSNEFSAEWKTEYLKIIAKCDEVINVSGMREKEGDVYMTRNKFMVDNSNMLICFHDGKSGGTRNTILYAQEKGLRIINILPL